MRNLVRAGIREKVAITMTAHNTRSVFERYNIVSEGDLDMAARRLDEISSTVGSSGLKAAKAIVLQTEENEGFTKCAPVAQVDRATVS